MRSVPAGTVTGAPSMVRFTSCSGITLPPSPVPRPVEICLKFSSELLDPAHDRSRARVGQHADSLARHVLRQVEQQVEILGLSLPRQNALHDLGRPRGAFPTLGAL